MLSRTTILLVGLLAILAGFVYFTEIRGKPRNGVVADQTPMPPIFGSIVISSVKAVDLQQNESEVKVARNDNGSWTLQQPSAPLTDNARVSGAITQLITVQKDRDVPLAAADLHQYGLDAPWMTVTVTATDGDHQLLIGGKNVDGSSRYATFKNSSSGFLLPTTTADALAALVTRPPIATPTVALPPVATLGPTPVPTPPPTPTP